MSYHKFSNLTYISLAQRLKSRFGQGYQVELKVLEPTKDDEDLNEIIDILLQFKSQLPSADVESEGRDEIYFTLDEASEAAQTVADLSHCLFQCVSTQEVGDWLLTGPFYNCFKADQMGRSS